MYRCSFELLWWVSYKTRITKSYMACQPDDVMGLRRWHFPRSALPSLYFNP
jgi:hypothetical protein